MLIRLANVVNSMAMIEMRIFMVYFFLSVFVNHKMNIPNLLHKYKDYFRLFKRVATE